MPKYLRDLIKESDEIYQSIMERQKQREQAEREEFRKYDEEHFLAMRNFILDRHEEFEALVDNAGIKDEAARRDLKRFFMHQLYTECASEAEMLAFEQIVRHYIGISETSDLIDEMRDRNLVKENLNQMWPYDVV